MPRYLRALAAGIRAAFHPPSRRTPAPKRRGALFVADAVLVLVVLAVLVLVGVALYTPTPPTTGHIALSQSQKQAIEESAKAFVRAPWPQPDSVSVAPEDSPRRASRAASGSRPKVETPVPPVAQTAGYTRVTLEDVSHAGARRYAARVTVPLGKTREELRAILERAARDVMREHRANAVMVFAYRPEDDPSGIYTAGRAVLAPNGRWEDAASAGPVQVSIDLGALYFSRAASTVSQGDTVVLSGKPGGQVWLSRAFENWRDEDIIGGVPVGSRAVVVERRSYALGDQELVRYRVRIVGRPAAGEGWVFRDAVEGAR